MYSKGFRSFSDERANPRILPRAHRVHVRSRIGRFEAVGSSLIQTLEQMAVRIQGDLDRRVTEPFLNDFRMLPLGDQERSMGMS